MKAKANIHAGLILLFICSIHANAQDLRTFNQNSSRTNHYRSAVASGLNLTFSPLFSTALNKNNDSLLFRGSGGGFRIAGDYFFGKTGIGFSSGFGSSAVDDNLINSFLQRLNISPDQVTVTKSNQQNIYLLAGPSVRFGSSVEILLHAKGGLFVNNSGLVMIQQKGAVRAAYMNGSTGKSIYPGFQTGFNVQYATKSDAWSFGISADYMGTKTEVNNYDVRRNGGVEGLKLSKTISDLVAGINVSYNIGAIKNKRNNNTARRVLPTVNKKEIIIIRDAGDEETGSMTQRLLPTVNKKEIIGSGGGQTERLLPTVNKKEIAIDEPGVQKTITSNCGPVTMKTTNPDGSVSETTFACPDDAAAYNRLTSVAKQTQGSSFGEKVQQGLHLHNSGVIHRDLSARNILLGKISLTEGNVSGIETNKTVSSKGKINNVKSGGINATIYARETGSGMATGRRQYQPVFADDATNACNDCIASVVSNPLYQSSGNTGNNPLYENEGKRLANTNDDCDGVSGLTVLLIDKTNNAVIASTKTEACGDFFFANLPSGPYAVKIFGTTISKKGYDVYLKNKTDIAGELLSANDHWVIEINTGTGTAEQAAAVIKTKTKSNQSNDRTITPQQDNSGIIWSPGSNLKVLPVATGDLDGDGTADLVVGNSFEGGNALRPGDPIPDIDITLKTAAGKEIKIPVDEKGQFMINDLKQGNYQFIITQKVFIDDNSFVMLDDNKDSSGSTKARNNNTVRSNRTDNALLNNDNNNDVNNIAIDEGGSSKPKVKNTTRDIGPIKWMAPEAMKKNINTSEDNLKNMLASLDALEQQLDADQNNAKAIINTSRSNIKSQRIAIADLEQTLDNLQMMEKDAAMKELEQKRNESDLQFLKLQDSLHKLGAQYTTISNVLKARHDIAMNAIRNMK